jgi:hypothetical protein
LIFPPVQLGVPFDKQLLFPSPAHNKKQKIFREMQSVITSKNQRRFTAKEIHFISFADIIMFFDI